MNSKMFMLGILLIAGLSFAGTANWMGYTESRYACNYFYSYNGYDDWGLMEIVYEYDSGCSYWTGCTDMENDLEGMDGTIWGMYGMYYNGCSNYLPNDFRADVSEYSVYSADFKAKFVAGLRAYLAAYPGARSAIMENLQDAMADYRYCLSDVRPCYGAG